MTEINMNLPKKLQLRLGGMVSNFYMTGGKAKNILSCSGLDQFQNLMFLADYMSSQKIRVVE